MIAAALHGNGRKRKRKDTFVVGWWWQFWSKFALRMMNPKVVLVKEVMT